MSNKQSNDSLAQSSPSVDGIADAAVSSVGTSTSTTSGAGPITTPRIPTNIMTQMLLDAIANDAIPQKYLDVAKMMMLSKSMYTAYTLGHPGYIELDAERDKLEKEIMRLKAKGEADEMKISHLERDTTALEQRVQDLETANERNMAENEKLANSLEIREGKLGDATACIQRLEVNVKEKNDEIAHFKNKIQAFEFSAAESNSLLEGFLEAKKKREEALFSMRNFVDPKVESIDSKAAISGINDKENQKEAVTLNSAKVESDKRVAKRRGDKARNDGQSSKRGKCDAPISE